MHCTISLQSQLGLWTASTVMCGHTNQTQACLMSPHSDPTASLKCEHRDNEVLKVLCSCCDDGKSPAFTEMPAPHMQMMLLGAPAHSRYGRITQQPHDLHLHSPFHKGGKHLEAGQNG